MAEPNNTETGKDAAPDSGSALPRVEAPSIAPADSADAAKESADKAEPDAKRPAPTLPTIFIEAQANRAASPLARTTLAIAATALFAAGIGVTLGVLASTYFNPPPPKTDHASLEEQQALQRTVAHLAKEVSALKTSDASQRTSIAQLGKIADRVDRIERASDITGSISKPSAPAPAPAPLAAGPAPQIAAAPPPAVLPVPRPQVLAGWTVREPRPGLVLAENRGNLYRVTVGALLPGLGQVEAIRRDGGQVTVVTPKGLIATPTPVRATYNRLPPGYFPPPFRPY